VVELEEAAQPDGRPLQPGVPPHGCADLA
jgi:hypothetical protein